MSEPVRCSARQVVAENRLLTIAHRGASRLAPENTLPAFQAALNLGVDLVELDYRVTADEVPVVLHDEELDRTTDAARRWQQSHIPVAARSLAELRTLDGGSWFSEQFAGTGLPTLREALRTITARSIALVERKAGPAQGCVDLLCEQRLLDRVVLQAFDWDFLADCRRLAPEVVLAALGENALTADKLDQICRRQLPVVAWDHQQVTAELVSIARGRGLRIWTWTVDDPARMRELASWGVGGIITNRPDLLLAMRDLTML